MCAKPEKSENFFVFASFLSIFVALKKVMDKVEMTQKDYIIDRATEMFSSLGIKAVRMDDIARQIGVSKRTLYELFGDKETLLKLCMYKYFDSNEEQLKQQIGSTSNVIETILTAFDMSLARGAVEHRMQTNLRRFYPKVYDELRVELGHRKVEKLKEYIRSGVNDGLLDTTIDIDLSVSMLCYSLSGIVKYQGVILPDNVTPEDALRYVIVNFLRGIATVKGLEVIDNFIGKQRKQR